MPKQYEDLLLKEVKELLKKLPPKVRIRVYYDDMGKKYTLNQIGEDLEKLTKYVTEGFKRVDARIDRIEARLDYNDLQIKEIQKRLDYNGLQIKEIQKRLDYNGLQIEGIQKRLDYNGLKQLPKSK